MMLRALRLPLLLSVLGVAVPCQEEPPSPPPPETPQSRLGQPAPALTIEKCVTGAAPAGFAAGKVHLVEFWGAAPDFGLERRRDYERLLRKHDGKLVVVGLLHGTETFGFDEVKQHYDEFGKDIAFCIAWDEGAKLHGAWPIPADEEPPVAFLVDGKGRLVWQGGYGLLGLVLPKVLAGDVDPAELAKATEEVQKRLVRVYLVMGLKPEKAVEEVDALLKDHPFLADTVLADVYGTLLEEGHRDEAMKLAARVCDLGIANEDAQLLNGLAWSIVDPEIETAVRDLVVAERTVKKAVELSKEKDSDILDTMARVCFCKQDFAGAIVWQKKAVAAEEDEEAKDALQQTLRSYEERAGKK